MLPDLLDLLTKQGFHFVTLPEAEKDPAYLRDPNAGFKDGGTLLDEFDGSAAPEISATCGKANEKAGRNLPVNVFRILVGFEEVRYRSPNARTVPHAGTKARPLQNLTVD